MQSIEKFWQRSIFIFTIVELTLYIESSAKYNRREIKWRTVKQRPEEIKEEYPNLRHSHGYFLHDGLEGFHQSAQSNLSRERKAKRRRRRQTSSNQRPVPCISGGRLSPGFKQQIIDAHNHRRRNVSPPASNMRLMTWDDQLEWLASRYTRSCTFKEHDAFAALKQGRHLADIERHSRMDTEVGFNWYAWNNTGDLPHNFIDDAMQGWMGQKRYYEHESRTCNSICRHYLQVVWARTYKVGCATSCCSNYSINGVRWRSTTLLVCAYAPRGNVVDFWESSALDYSYSAPFQTLFPYSYGAACQRCNEHFENVIFDQNNNVVFDLARNMQGGKQADQPSSPDYCNNFLCANVRRDSPIPFTQGPYATTTFSWHTGLSSQSTSSTINDNYGVTKEWTSYASSSRAGVLQSHSTILIVVFCCSWLNTINHLTFDSSFVDF